MTHDCGGPEPPQFLGWERRAGMGEQEKRLLVAVNVMRTRVTVVGFNIAIVSFQLTELRSLTVGQVKLPSIHSSAHIDADIALFMGLALSLAALVVFVASSRYDPVGVCTPWLVVLGDVLMYLALAESTAAFFEPFLGALVAASRDFGQHQAALQTVVTAVAAAGATAWFLAVYVGPVLALWRAPRGISTTLPLAACYLALLLLLAWVRVNAGTLQDSRTEGATVRPTLVGELLAPLSWAPERH